MSRKGLRRLALSLTACSFLTVGVVPLIGAPGTTDWPQFRGQARDGVSSETGLADSWPEGGPKQLWRRPIGTGYSGITVVGDRIYTMYADEGESPQEFACSIDAATGDELWRTPIGKRFDNQFGNGPRSTPTVFDDALYVLDSNGNFAALASADGKLRWTVNLTEEFGSQLPTFGFSSSPVVIGDAVLLQVGGTEGRSFAAFDRTSGKVAWSFGEGPAGYSSSLPVTIQGVEQFVAIANQKVHSLNADGKELWSHVWPPGESHSMPLFLPPDRIFASGTEGIGAAMLKVQKTEDGFAVEELWNTPLMRNHFSSSVVHAEHIYGFDNATLKCISAADAHLAWAKRGFGKGSLILADDKLIVLSDRGQLLLIKADPASYQQLGSVQALDDRSWTSPTLSGGRLYLRNNTEIVAYDVTGS